MATLSISSEQPPLTLKRVAILDRTCFEGCARRNTYFMGSYDFIVTEFFGEKPSPFKESLIWQRADLASGEHEIIIGELDNAAKDTALSILYFYCGEKKGDNHLRIYALDHPFSKKPLTLDQLRGKTIQIGRKGHAVLSA